MKIPFENFHLSVNTNYFSPTKPTVLFLHGFSGSSKDWSKIITLIDSNFSSLSVDLVGHGDSDSPPEIKYYKIESITTQLKTILSELKLEKVILAGYSMGGRAALNFSNYSPELISGIILESTTAGIESKEERMQRFNNDKKLAEKILSAGIEKFFEEWMNLPIFESQNSLPQNKLEEIKLNKMKNNSQGLANSLLGFSTGKMKPIWESLQNFNFPVLLLAGELDRKYISLNEKMDEFLPDSKLHIIKDAGHNVHLEKPTEFVILVNQFLRTNFL